ncbi:hypothetical protein [Thiothrix subterranea]|uniref:hypothetical protein n=1 Tax=Thiothrix subterranea TaxID=2735563 RepID=UPI00280C3BDC|nr:hypothetical protein [Thiothrix subterranea]
MEIAGQIIRNRHATMTRESIANLADNGISAGLRFLEFFINISDSSKKEIIDIIEKHLEEHPTLSSKKIIDYAEKIYLHLTYDVISAVVRKIASSVGFREAVEIYNALEEKEKTPAFILINQSIEFQFERILNIDSVRSTAEKLKNNPVCLRILKEMVIQHIYMFPVEYKKKQQLSELLKISVQDQRLMDQKKLGKG